MGRTFVAFRHRVEAEFPGGEAFQCLSRGDGAHPCEQKLVGSETEAGGRIVSGNWWPHGGIPLSCGEFCCAVLRSRVCVRGTQ